MDRLAAMTTFRRVVELQSFAAAARDLRRSGATVSKQVAWLEAQLKSRLLNRTTRRLHLTEAGRIYYEHCARILDELAEVEEAVAQHEGAPRGLLRVSAPMSFGVRHLGPALPGFLARYPEITLDLGLDDRVVDLMDEGWDMAIRIADLPDSGLVARRIATSRRVLAASPDYLARAGTPQTPADLAAHNCLIYSYLARREDIWQFDGADGPASVRIAGTLRANNGGVLAQAAAAGIGIVLAPLFIIDDLLRDGRLQILLPDYRAADTGIHAVWPQGRHPSPKLRALVDFLIDRFGREPPWETAAQAATAGRPAVSGRDRS